MLYEKKCIYLFGENVLHTCVIRCSVLFLVIFTKKENDINHFFYFVKNVFSHILAEGERDLECLSVWKYEINNQIMGFKDELKLRLLDVLLKFSFLSR